MQGTRTRRTAGILAAVVAALAPPGAAAEVWVVDDSVRLDPVDGSVIEERHPAPDAVDAGYRDDNPVWSASDRTVRLLAGRNEVVAFQVVVDGGPHAGVSLAVGDLEGPVTLLASETVRLHRQWFVEVTRESRFCAVEGLVTSLGLGWYPDALIPLELPVASGFGQPFDIPDDRNRVPGQTATAFWVDVLVPARTPPGVYRATVTVTLNGTSSEIPLELDVRGFTLSSFNHAGLGSVNYGGLGFEVWNGPAGPDGLVPWFQMAHAHRLELDAMWIWPNRAGRPVEWDAWREGWRPFMTGSAFTRAAGYHGPSEGEPIRRFVLPNESNWPIEHFGWDDPRPIDEQAWQRALARVEEILIEEGWTGIEAHLFVNATDEPRDRATYDLIRYFGELVDGAALVDRGHVRFRVDTGNFKNVGELIAGWDVERIFAEVGDFVDVWNHNGAPRYVDSAAMARRVREHPDEAWWVYNTCSAGEPGTGSPVLEGEALGMRTWGWTVFRYGLEGAVTWEMDGGRHDRDVTRCWTDPSCSGWGINGDAVLFYLGEHVGLPGQPVASVRVKSLRRGSQDHEYLRLLAAADGGRDRADAIAARVLPRALDDGLVSDGSTGRWAHDPRAYEGARREIADLLPADPLDPDPGDGGPGDGGSGDGGVDGGPGDGGPGDGPGDGGPGDGGGCGCRAAGSAPARARGALHAVAAGISRDFR